MERKFYDVNSTLRNHIRVILLCICLILPQTGCANVSAGGDEKISVGVVVYSFDDTFMEEVRSAIKNTADKENVRVEIWDSQGSQNKQNEQIDQFIKQGVDVLAINPVDRTAAGVIIEKAKQENIPIVFFNREPIAQDLQKWDKLYYVGAQASMSGMIAGQILAEYWKEHPEMDKNSDGKMQYVMIKGEPGHQDVELRKKYSISYIEQQGIQVDKLAEDSAMWDRQKAKERMLAIISTYGDQIEAVIAQNDDMAIGAIEALKEQGYFTSDRTFVPVVGVNATLSAIQAIKEGVLLGTSYNDAQRQGQATLLLAKELAEGKNPQESGFEKETGFSIDQGHYIWVRYIKITSENTNDALRNR